MWSTNSSGRKYPLILESYVQTQSGDALANSATVNGDAEYESFCKRADRFSHKVVEKKHPDVVKQELEDTAIKKEREDAVHELTKYNLKNAKRIYKSYPITQGVAWFAGITAIVLGYLKLAEVFKFPPYREHVKTELVKPAPAPPTVKPVLRDTNTVKKLEK